MKNLIHKIYSLFGKDQFKISLFFLLIFFSIFSIYIIHPVIESDSVSYVDAMSVLKTGVVPTGFSPYRIVTTYLGLRGIMLVDLFFGNLNISWLLFNSLLYIAMGMFFYSLLVKLIENRRTAFLGTLFLVTNYAGMIFSFHYLMDVGGWAFYIASIYFSFKYLESRKYTWLLIASVLVGLGGLFKEYAYLAYVVVFGLIIFTYWKNWKEILKRIIVTGFLSFTPMLLINIYSHYVYHGTYLDWFFNQPVYAYKSRLGEYVKAFGSLYNFGWFIFVGGVYLFLKRLKNILSDEKILFIALVCASSLLVFVWPIVTRVLFITIPGVVLISSLFLKKIDKWWYAVVPLLVLYVISSYFMDSFILNFVNLPF